MRITNFPSPGCTAATSLWDNTSSLRTGWQVLAACASGQQTMARKKQKYGMILLPDNGIVAILLILFVMALPLSIMMAAASVPIQQKSVHIAVTNNGGGGESVGARRHGTDTNEI
jgi:hypothetical protein